MNDGISGVPFHCPRIKSEIVNFNEQIEYVSMNDIPEDIPEVFNDHDCSEQSSGEREDEEEVGEQDSVAEV